MMKVLAASVHQGLALILGHQHPGYDQRHGVHPGETQYAWQEGRK